MVGLLLLIVIKQVGSKMIIIDVINNLFDCANRTHS